MPKPELLLDYKDKSLSRVREHGQTHTALPKGTSMLVAHELQPWLHQPGAA